MPIPQNSPTHSKIRRQIAEELFDHFVKLTLKELIYVNAVVLQWSLLSLMTTVTGYFVVYPSWSIKEQQAVKI